HLTEHSDHLKHSDHSKHSKRVTFEAFESNPPQFESNPNLFEPIRIRIVRFE
ncbi:hypothetical protein BGZ51_006954, partial [Haplosporangium sp. Z 767]